MIIRGAQIDIEIICNKRDDGMNNTAIWLTNNVCISYISYINIFCYNNTISANIYLPKNGVRREDADQSQQLP